MLLIAFSQGHLFLAKVNNKNYLKGVPTDLQKLANRSETQSAPVPGFELEPLPPEMVKAFPKMEDWRKAQNKRFLDYTKRLNTTLRP